MKRLLLTSLVLLAFFVFSPTTHAAVGFGAISAVDNAISRTSVTVSGSNTVGVVFVAGDTTGDNITSVTWGGVSMTKINSSSVLTPGARYLSAWCVNNPASAATIQFSTDSESYWRNYDAYYTGASCPADSNNVGTSAASTVISVSTTVVDANSWLIMFQGDSVGGKTYSASGSLTTMRANTDAGGQAIADSNGTVGSGSKTGTLTAAGNAGHGAIVFSLAPAATASFQIWTMDTF